MRANEKRAIKSRLVNVLEEMGFKWQATDTPEIVIFTDKPVNEKSVRYGESDTPYITSWGVKGASAFIEKNRTKH